MKQDNAERHVIFAFSVLLLLFCCLDCAGKPGSGQRGEQCDVSYKMRHVPRPRWRRLCGWKNHECSGPSVSRGPEADQYGTRSDNF